MAGLAEAIGYEPRTAPGELALVHAFLNTWHADGPRERLESPERLRDWLVKRSLLAPAARVSVAEFEGVRRLRDGLRRLIGTPADGVAAAELEAINRLGRKMPLVVQFDAAGNPRLEPGGSGVQIAVARILAGIAAGRIEGTWPRLKLCRNVGCQRIFYDTSKNHSAIWCSSQICGNRMHARAHRARAHRDGEA